MQINLKHLVYELYKLNPGIELRFGDPKYDPNAKQRIFSSGDPEKMIKAGLTALLTTLRDNPRMARIIYIDAMLVQELHNQATIHETMLRFDRMIHAFVMLMMPNLKRSDGEIALVSTGLNGYVTQIAIRWVMSGFKQSMDEVLSSCSIVFMALLNNFAELKQ